MLGHIPVVNGRVDRNRTGGHLIESQGRLTSNLNYPTNGRSDGTRTHGHLIENQGRLAYNLNAPTKT